MDVTRQNFRDVYDVVEKAVSDAAFIAIDGEFTGVTNFTFNLTHFDSPEERYYKLRHNISDYLLMQFGLVTFTWDTDKQHYVSKGFNFYIFPFRSSASGVPDRIFSCQSSSIDFLASQRFDFNKVFHHGIPYLRQQEQAALSSSLKEKHMMRIQNFKSPRKSMDSGNQDVRSPSCSPTVVTDARTQAFLDGVKEKIREFLQTSNESDTLELEPCNSYLRKILYETVPNMFPEALHLEARTTERTKQRYLVVSRLGSDEDQLRKHDEAKARDDSTLLDAVGFSRVIQLLSKSGKIIVGHNMLLDLLLTMQQFVQPLPSTLDELKALTTLTFPLLIDTKLMGSTLPFRELILNTALNELHNRLHEKPFTFPDIVPPDKYRSDEDSDLNLHEAAYDAYITGKSFLAMLKFLTSLKPNEDGEQAFTTIPTEIISPYLNKVFLMRSSEIPYLNISGDDLSPSRSHVFHVQFPTAWKTGDIRMLFAPVSSAIQISWINDTQCFVSLNDRSQVDQVKRILMRPGGMESNPYIIRTYEEYQRDMAGQVFSMPTWRPRGNTTTYSKNKVWRPPIPQSSSTTSQPTTQPDSTTAQIVSNYEFPRSTVTSRKRSGEDAAIAKPSSVRRISSTSNRIGSLDLGEPDVKRNRVIEVSNGASTSVPVSQSRAKTDIPAHAVPTERDEDMDNSTSTKSAEMFEIPEWE